MSVGDVRIEALDALAGAVSCHAALEQVDHLKQCLIQIQQLLPKIPDLPAKNRQAWEQWLKDATNAIKDPGDAKP